MGLLPSYRSFFIAFLALAVILGGAIYGYARFEGLAPLDGLWLAIVSIATVGYGDIVAVTPAGRILTLFLIVTGLGLFSYLVSSILVFFIEGRIFHAWRMKKMLKEIARLRQHIIVCGAGRVGTAVIQQLRHHGAPFVAIELNPVLAEQLAAEKVLILQADATEDEALVRAGVKRARSVITTLPDDAMNVFVAITCKDLNPNVRVITRITRPDSAARLKRAGADAIISPAAIAGNRMALAALKPASVSFIQTLVERRDVSLELEELVVGETSPLAGRTLAESRLREDFGAQLLAIQRGEETLVNPEPSTTILPGDLLIVFGRGDRLAALELYVMPRALPTPAR